MQEKYNTYESQKISASISLEYPAGWKFVESQGGKGSYSEVSFYAPKDRKKKLGGYVSFLVRSGEMSSAEQAMERMIQLRSKMPSMKVVEQGEAGMLGAKARVCELAYDRPYDMKRMSNDLVSVRERIVIQERSGSLYVFSFMSEREDRGFFIDRFQHMLDSLRFKSQ